MAQDAGQGLGIHAAGQSMGGERMSQVMESDVGQTGLLEQYLQSAVSRVRICRQLRAGGMGEYPLTDGSLLSLPQELYDALGQDDGACALAGLGVAQGEYAHLFTMEGTAYFQRAFLLVEVLPHEAADFTPPQSGHKLGVEELIPDLVLSNRLHEGVQLLLVQDALGLVIWPGCGRSLGGILRDDVCLHRVLHGAVEHGMDVVDGGVGELISILGMLMDTPLFFQAAVHALDVLTGDKGHLLVSQLGLDVAVDELAVALHGAGADGAFLVLRQPDVQPFAQRHAAVLGQLHILVALDALVELVCQLLLGVGIVMMEDGVAVFLVSHHDAAFPATVIAFAHHAVTRWSAFCHLSCIADAAIRTNEARFL